MHRATFVLSTGRCGTQWLTQTFAKAFGDRMRVEHEPLHNDYAPRRMLGVNDPTLLDPRSALRVMKHVEEIERTLETRGYFETGHPCWSSVPWLMRRFDGRIRVVHLVRHPVPTACSWVSHGAFVPPLLPHLPVKELVSPFDAGASFPEYREVWATLSPFERSLVYWAEVQALGVRLERAGGLPWLRLRYEDLFDPASDALARLVAFVGLPAEAVHALDRGEQVDRHRFVLAKWPELERVVRHTRVVELATELGYRAGEFAVDGLAGRFLVRPAGGIT